MVCTENEKCDMVQTEYRTSVPQVMERDRDMERKKSKKRRGGGFLPVLCNILGILILAAVIASYLPLSVPRLLGYEIYDVLSGSMEPTIPVGSVIYVQYTEPTELEEGDVIAFYRDADVIAHRVVSNESTMGRLATKGDANEEQDVSAVDYTAVIGRVTFSVPYLGNLMDIYASTIGKVYALVFAACGAMLNILAGRMRDRRRSAAVEEYLRSREE